MSNQVMMWCSNCQANTLHIQPSTSHVLHFLLSLITFGLWIIVCVLVKYFRTPR